MKTGRRNNSGFSLIELIIILAIMAILGVGLISLTGMIGNTQSRKCIEGINTAIQRTKSDTLAKAKGGDGATEIYLEIWDGGSNGIMLRETIDTVTHEKNIGPQGLDVYVDGTMAAKLPGEGAALKISFDRSSGAVESTNFTKISSGKFSVKVEPHTGKCKLETN